MFWKYSNKDELVCSRKLPCVVYDATAGKLSKKRTEFFLFRIFLHSVRIQENTEQKKLHIWTLFRQYAENTSGSFVYKSSHRMCSVRKGAFRKFTGKHLCQSLFLIKLQALEHLFYRAPLGHCFCI